MSQSATPNPSDILFLSPTVISGDEQSHPFVADVLVSSGLITEIFPPGSIKGSHARRIEASGHYLSPGFIDMHAHSDLYLLTHPDHEPKISQGCTVRLSSTNIIGC
jgi:N-acyl-D-amino-acid deacylase